MNVKVDTIHDNISFQILRMADLEQKKYFDYVEVNWISFAHKNPYLSPPEIQELIWKSWKKLKNVIKPGEKKTNKKVKPQPSFPGFTNPHLEKMLVENSKDDGVRKMNKDSAINVTAEVSTIDITSTSHMTPTGGGNMISTEDITSTSHMTPTGGNMISTGNINSTSHMTPMGGDMNSTRDISSSDMTSTTTRQMTHAGDAASTKNMATAGNAPSLVMVGAVNKCLNKVLENTSGVDTSNDSDFEGYKTLAEMEQVLHRDKEINDQITSEGGEVPDEGVTFQDDDNQEMVDAKQIKTRIEGETTFHGVADESNEVNESSDKDGVCTVSQTDKDEPNDTSAEVEQIEEISTLQQGHKRKKVDGTIPFDFRPAKRKSSKPTQFVPPRKISCGVSDCTFCLSASCKSCKNCLSKKKCTLRDCPRLKQKGISSKYPLCASLMVKSASNSTDVQATNADLETEYLDAITEQDVGREYGNTSPPKITSPKEQFESENIDSEMDRRELLNVEENQSEHNTETEGVEATNFDDGKTSDKSKGTKCEKCSKVFKQLKSYNTHKCQPEIPKKRCPACSKEVSAANFAKHVKLHSVVKFKCSLCPKEFLTEEKKDRHFSDHKEFKCDICEKVFLKSFFLNRHNKQVHTVKNASESQEPESEIPPSVSVTSKQVCKFCKEGLKSLTDLTKHMRKEHIDEAIYCDQCDKPFFCQQGLKDHKKLHISTSTASDTNEVVIPDENVIFLLDPNIEPGDLQNMQIVFLEN